VEGTLIGHSTGEVGSWHNIAHILHYCKQLQLLPTTMQVWIALLFSN